MKLMKLLSAVLTVISIMIVLTVTASAETYEQYEYKLLEDDTISITNYTGSDSQIEIPSQIEGVIVTAIEDGVFSDNSSIQFVTIPDSLTAFGERVFIGCENLTILCNQNSAAHTYALENNLKFHLLDVLIPPDVSSLQIESISPSSISISWNKALDATGYVVYQDIKGKWQEINITKDNTITVTNLSAGKDYRFAVRTYKTLDDVNYHYSENYTEVIMTTLPAKPVAKMTNNTAQAIRLAWDKVEGATGYVVYRQINGSWKRAIVTKNNVFVFTKLSGGTNYNLAVRAYKTFNGKNYYSPFTTKIDTIKACTKPTTVTFTVTRSPETAKLKWNKVTGASGYKVYYRTKGSSWKLVANTKSLSCNINNIKAGYYDFTVKAYKVYNGVTYNGTYSSKTYNIVSKDSLYYIKSSAKVYTKAYKYYTNISSGSYYTGYYDPKYPNYIVLDYNSSEILIHKSKVTVRSNAVVLGTSCIGQLGGKIKGYSACGPTTVAMLLNSEKGTSWNKDNLILYSEKKKLNDQGSLRSYGGMTAPRLLELIEGYSGGKYTAKNLYSKTQTPSSILKKQIDNGKRAIVVTRYTSTIVTHTNSGAHFVAVCGYEYIKGKLYFYYADPYYGNGGRSLKRIDATTLNKSMNLVNSEPRTIIVLN